MATLDAEYIRKRLGRFSGIGDRLRQGVGASTILRLLLALALSLGLWVYVTMRNNPDISQTFTSRPVETRGLAAGSALLTQLPSVDITLAGPTGLIQSPNRPVSAYVDLANSVAMRGQRIPIKVDVPRGVELVAVNPSEVVIDVEPIMSRDYPVQVAVPPGLPSDQRIEQPTIEPRTVTVTGPRSTIGDISRVVVRPELGGNPDELSRAARPIPLDVAGREVTSPRLEISPSNVTITLPSRTLRSSKTVPVRYSIVGQPASGYQIGSIQTTPAQINIVGDADLLQRVTAIETEPIDITDRRLSLMQTVPLRVPPGVTAEQPTVQVDVGIAPIEARVRLTLNVIPVGYAPGLRVQVVPGTVDVTLKGPVPRIQAIDVGALRAEVRLQGYGPGTYLVAPQVIGPGLDGLEIVEIQPPRVTVQLMADQTPVSATSTPPSTTPTGVPATPTSPPP